MGGELKVRNGSNPQAIGYSGGNSHFGNPSGIRKDGVKLKGISNSERTEGTGSIEKAGKERTINTPGGVGRAEGRNTYEKFSAKNSHLKIGSSPTKRRAVYGGRARRVRSYRANRGGGILQSVNRQNDPERVREVQKFLYVFGYLKASDITGRYGPETRRAVTEFQREFQETLPPKARKKFQVDGIVGPKTYEALYLYQQRIAVNSLKNEVEDVILSHVPNEGTNNYNNYLFASFKLSKTLPNVLSMRKKILSQYPKLKKKLKIIENEIEKKVNKLARKNLSLDKKMDNIGDIFGEVLEKIKNGALQDYIVELSEIYSYKLIIKSLKNYTVPPSIGLEVFHKSVANALTSRVTQLYRLSKEQSDLVREYLYAYSKSMTGHPANFFFRVRENLPKIAFRIAQMAKMGALRPLKKTKNTKITPQEFRERIKKAIKFLDAKIESLKKQGKVVSYSLIRMQKVLKKIEENPQAFRDNEGWQFLTPNDALSFANLPAKAKISLTKWGKNEITSEGWKLFTSSFYGELEFAMRHSDFGKNPEATIGYLVSLDRAIYDGISQITRLYHWGYGTGSPIYDKLFNMVKKKIGLYGIYTEEYKVPF